MKAARILSALLCLAAVAGITAGDAAAHGSRARVGVHVGTVWGPWMYPPPWYYPPPVVVVPAEPPPVYIEQRTPPDSAFWHYCRSAGAYYPYVGECREGWLKVLPEQEK